MEVKLGKNHSKSPFELLYAANGMAFSTCENKDQSVQAPVEENK